MALPRHEYTFPSLAWLLLFLTWLLLPNHHFSVRLLPRVEYDQHGGSNCHSSSPSNFTVPAGAVRKPLRSQCPLCGNAGTGSLVDMEYALRALGSVKAQRAITGHYVTDPRGECSRDLSSVVSHSSQ